jgi:hypothetical protein
MIGDLGPLLPAKYSPIGQSSGNGHEKAYLAEVSQAVFDMVTGSSSFDLDRLVADSIEGPNRDSVVGALDAVALRALEGDQSLDSTVKENLILARRGQGRFRANVAAIETRCRLTGVTNPALLVASHVKPWRACVSGAERLDGSNGLLLTPSADRLFDRGLLSFADNGSTMLSTRLDLGDLVKLGLGHLSGGIATAPAAAGLSPPFAADQKVYLAYHRTEVFLP